MCWNTGRESSRSASCRTRNDSLERLVSRVVESGQPFPAGTHELEVVLWKRSPSGWSLSPGDHEVLLQSLQFRPSPFASPVLCILSQSATSHENLSPVTCVLLESWVPYRRPPYLACF